MTQEVSDSKIHFRCSKCQAKYSALPEQSGKKGICKNCGAQIKVPNPDSASSKAGDAAIIVRRIWIPQTLASVMLAWALNPDNPYGYYILLRWVCCGVFAYVAYQSFEHEKQGWVWVLGITALFYNPIFPVHLNRALWSIVNVVTIGIAVVSILALRVEDKEQDTA